MLPLRYYLVFVHPSMLPSKQHGVISLKCLSDNLRVGAFEIDYK
jgi:hypothetical protein